MKINLRSSHPKTLAVATIVMGLLILASNPQNVLAQSNTFPSTGNVGIGTTTPSNALVIGTDIGAQANPTSSLVVANPSNNSLITVGQSSTARLRMKWIYNAITNSAYGIIGTQDINNPLVLQELGGKVGIGTMTPGFKLDLQGGQINSSGGLCIAGDCKTAWSQVGGGGSPWMTFGSNVYYTSGNVGIGTTAPDSLITVNANTSGLQAPGTNFAGTLFHLSGADNSKVRFLMDAFGSGFLPQLTYRFARGTAAAPSAVQSGDALGQITASGYQATAYTQGSRATINFLATENWTDSANGTAISFATDTNGGASVFERMRIDNSGNVGIGTTTPGFKLDLQGGQINSSGGLCIAGDCKTAWSQVGGGGSSTVTAANVSAHTFGANTGGGSYAFPSNLSVSGNLYLPGAAGNNFFSAGTGDGATYSNYNFALNGWWGMALKDYSGTVRGVYDFRSGNLTTDGVANFKGTGNNSFAGNVGIGTASPQGTLHTKGLFLFFDDSAGSISGGIFANPLASNPFTLWSGAGDFRVGTGVADRVGTGFSERLRILNSNGNVGIGTNAPGFKLDVQGGQLNASGGLCIAGDCKTAWSQVGGGSGSPWTSFGSNVSFTTGNVGIWATAPAVKLAVGGNGVNIYATDAWIENNLHVQGNEVLGQGGRGRLRVGTAWGYPGLYPDASSTGTGNDLILGAGSGTVRVGPGTTQQNFIVPNGNVGIGTASPASKLHIYNNSGSRTMALMLGQNISNVGEGGAAIEVNTAGAGTLYLSAYKPGTGYGTTAIQPEGGNVGIGTTGPGFKLDVQGGQLNASGGLCIAGDCKTAWSQVGGGSTSPWTTFGSNVYYNTGNVGIGTTAPGPGFRLDVQGGPLNASGGLCIAGDCKTAWSQVGGGGSSQWTTTGSNVSFNTGNVGLGTTGPGTKLHVVKPYTTDGVGGTSLPDTSWGVYKADMQLLLDTGGTRTINRGGGIGFSNGDGFVLGAIKGAATNSTASQYGGYLGFYTTGLNSGGGATNGYERMRIDENGNVGLGTTGPAFKLDVQGGQLNASGGLCIAGDCKTAWSQVGGGGSSQWITFGSNVSYNTGSVGIGTTGPGFKLDVQGGQLNASGGLCIAGDCKTAWSQVGGGGSSQWTTAGSNVYYNTGNVGIGATSPAFLLDVLGSTDNPFRVRDSSQREYFSTTTRTGTYATVPVVSIAGSRLIIDNSGPEGGNDTVVRRAVNNLIFSPSDHIDLPGAFMVRQKGGSTILHIDQNTNGNVGIGNTTPTYKLDVNGEINATGLRINGTPISTGGGTGGAVNSVYGRTGAVAAQPGDYTWSQITKTTSSLADITTRSASDLSSGTLPDARFPAILPAVSGASLTSLNALNLTGTVPAVRLGSGPANATTFLRGDNTWAPLSGGGGAVDSVYGRTGAVAAQPGDYTWLQITKTTSSLADITTRSAGDLSSGTLPDARFPATLPAASGLNLTFLNASSLASGTVPLARLGSGAVDSTKFLRGDNTWAVPSGGSQWTTSGTTNVYYNTGNVGIGTDTPSFMLDVRGSSNSPFRVKDSSDREYFSTTTRTVNGNTVPIVSIAGSRLIIDNNGPEGGNDTVVRRNVNSLIFSPSDNSGLPGAFIVRQVGGSSILHIDQATNGNVGIGTAPSANKLEVNGNTNVTGNLNASGAVTGGTINAKYQDVAEWVESSQELLAGTVVVLDHTKSNQVVASSQAYDTRVAGVISLQPGITLGESGAGKVLVATTGRVRIKVDATAGPIQIGDLLVTSDIPGVAMRSQAISVGGVQIHRPGTLIGKALEPLAKGIGEILVLLSLQ